jgi:hypothetical protein
VPRVKYAMDYWPIDSFSMSYASRKVIFPGADVEWTLQHNNHQWSVNDFWICKYCKFRVLWLPLVITDILASFVVKQNGNTVIV